MRLKCLRTALRNVDEEATNIATDGPEAARAVVQRVLDAVGEHADRPGLGRPGRVPRTRELVVRKTRYIVPCRVSGVPTGKVNWKRIGRFVRPLFCVRSCRAAHVLGLAHFPDSLYGPPAYFTAGAQVSLDINNSGG